MRKSDSTCISNFSVQNGHSLSDDELGARYDFNLVALLRAWRSHWTPESHQSFQPEFRAAIYTLFLSLNARWSIPNEIIMKIATFLSRDFFTDRRRQCWYFTCQSSRAIKRILRKQGCKGSRGVGETTTTTESDSKASACFPCPKCKVAWYCSKACQVSDYKEGHKKVCGSPPYQNKSDDNPAEYEVYRTLFEEASMPSSLAACRGIAENTGAATAQNLDKLSASGERSFEGSKTVWCDEDDEGSWESIDSGDEDVPDDSFQSETTKAICRFFRDNAS